MQPAGLISKNMTPTDACFTHYAEHMPEPWMAIHKDSAFKLLKDYNLTELQKADVGYLIAAYCRLLDEAGLIHYGKTESEVILKAVS